MKRMRTVLAATVAGLAVSVAGTASASDRAPTLQSAPRAALGARVVVTGYFFAEKKPATLYLEVGTTRKQLATSTVKVGGLLKFSLRLPASAPKNAHLLVCQNRCASRVRLALAR
jgi:hypothetical protein